MNGILFASVYSDFIHRAARRSADFASSLLENTLFCTLGSQRSKKKTTQKTRKNKKPFLSKRFVKGGINFTFDVHF